MSTSAVSRSYRLSESGDSDETEARDSEEDVLEDEELA